VAEDHQTKNAMALVERQAAILIKDQDALQNLAGEAISLLQNQAKQVQLKNNIATFDMPDAAESIVNELLKLLKKD
jgi:UDP-N-acetylglucosamine--N-acetylmuramyl-(pentapeptide) pyrophosphoryl-undecaprenol N-acetylglucosamine transferase